MTPTPGPWTIGAPLPSDQRWLIRGAGRSAALATVLTNADDAHLIAASPDLLEALQLIQEKVSDEDSDTPANLLLDAVHDIALAAIDKAEGREP